MKKNCLIIGASGDIGVKIAERLANDGYTLLLHYHQNNRQLEALVSLLPEETVLQIVQGDLSTTDGINKFLTSIHFDIDTIVFASGRSIYGLFHETDLDEMDRMLTIHVKALWMISKHFLPKMITKKDGQIIVISSIWGEDGASCEVVYSTVKGAQISFVKSLAKEVASSGISVNGISPGFIETKMNDGFTLEEKQVIIDQIPVNRAGRPEDIAHAVAFLLDDRSSYIQGEILRISGAW
ncbi:elongation factor P 5-aminopentanone reductase [Radiobacillus sp. PE A8.2]|uniref:elongation factor P 5-aminopentanone reductase n=1 Tax=Radiobacillus sp. PE A8.2 TaxID=3380349 RepID=UPI00388E6444